MGDTLQGSAPPLDQSLRPLEHWRGWGPNVDRSALPVGRSWAPLTWLGGPIVGSPKPLGEGLQLPELACRRGAEILRGGPPQARLPLPPGFCMGHTSRGGGEGTQLLSTKHCLTRIFKDKHQRTQYFSMKYCHLRYIRIESPPCTCLTRSPLVPG